MSGTLHSITPQDPEFDQVAERLASFLENLDGSEQRRLATEEASFRAFCAYALRQIASSLGYIIANASEFIKDMAWSAQTGWNEGVAAARRKRLRP